MDHFYRVIWFGLGVLLVGLPMVAFSQQQQPKYTYNTVTSWGVPQATLEQACQARIASFNNPGAVSTGWSLAQGSYVHEWTPLPPVGQGGSKSVWCPYTLNGNGPYWDTVAQYALQLSWGVPPTCEGGQVWNSQTGQCEAPPNPCEEVAGDYWGDGIDSWLTSKPWAPSFFAGSQTSRPSHVCIGSCRAELVDVEFAGMGDNGWYAKAYARATGATCSDAPVAPEPDKLQSLEESDEYKCTSQGLGYGYVGNLVVCTQATGTTENTQTQTTTNNETGEKTETTTKTERNRQTGVTTTTTTTRVYSSGGQLVSQSSSTSTSHGGGGDDSGWGEAPCDNAGPPACNGDAIQCAIARQGWELKCAHKLSQDARDYANAAMSYTGEGDGDSPLTPLEIDVKQWTIPNTGTGGGLQDKAFMVWGKQIVLPFSRLNEFLRIFGYAVMACAWLVAYRIIREAM